jgi:hypothetical protein
MSKDLGDFFSDISEEEAKKQQEILEGASSSRNEIIDVVPGKYVMDVATIVGKKKDDGSRFIAPSVVITSKNSLMLKLVLKVADKGTKECPSGASIFHNIVLLPAKGADDKKIQNVFNIMKPQIVALTGNDDFSMTQSFIEGDLTIQVDENGKVISDHNMKEKVFVTVDEEFNEFTNRVDIVVKNIRAFREGDISETIQSQDGNEELPFSGEDTPSSSNGDSEIVDAEIVEEDDAVSVKDSDRDKVEDF